MENVKYYKKIFLKEGLVNYSEEDRGETLLLSKAVIDAALDTIRGTPLVITHDSEEPVGQVVEAYYDADRAVYVVGFNTDSKEAKDLLDNRGWSVSCTYLVSDSGAGGIYHDIAYDREVFEMRFLNLALVEKPRYQEALDYINESQRNKQNTQELVLGDIFNNFNNQTNGDDSMSFFTKKEEKQDSPGTLEEPKNDSSGDSGTILESLAQKIELVLEKLESMTAANGENTPEVEETKANDGTVVQFLLSKGLTAEQIEMVEDYYKAEEAGDARAMEVNVAGEPATTDNKALEDKLAKQNSSSVKFEGEKLRENWEKNCSFPEKVLTRAERIRLSNELMRLKNKEE
jgi:hypothetical protein